MSEFNIIQEFFNWPHKPESVITAVGDDAALLQNPKQQQMVVSVDTLISGVHFPEATMPEAIAHKALAVNLSDLAAMGAKPTWFTLALTLPDYNVNWLTGFAQGLRLLAQQAGVFLVGGDTTRGPLSISIQVMGHVEPKKALLRSTAQAGDLICVSGTLGDAAAGLAILQNKLTLPDKLEQHCITRLNYPQARLRLGQILKSCAHSCMDISDGLIGDLQHILKSSQVGAILKTPQIPLSKALATLPQKQRLALALSGGDDYELLFTLPAKHFASIYLGAQQENIAISCIGQITESPGQLNIDFADAQSLQAYNHFG